jgi:hypothetical protein
MVYTEGIEDLAKQADAYWLIDLVASWTFESAIRTEEFVVWKPTSVSAEVGKSIA